MDVSREDLKIIIMDLLDAGQFISDESFNTACECSVCKEKAVKVIYVVAGMSLTGKTLNLMTRSVASNLILNKQKTLSVK